ncbi:hypothetical protein FZ029_32645 [Azospirillum sp. Sh1]|nr:hypothetical protein [Azospirillum sp. Sh1]KAA0568841.1 hypothetical protein FZ029_32645 [Azospirillum sp. Sh1]
MNTTLTDWQGFSQVVALKDGGWVVTWESRGAQDGSGSGMYQQRYDAAGNPVGLETRVNSYTSGDQTYAAVSALTDGGWVVVWQSAGQDGNFTGVYGQVFNADGTRRGGERLINQTTAYDQYQPAVTGLADGTFMVSWGNRNSPGSYSLFGRKFNADGTPTAGEFQISPASAADAAYPELSARPDGGFTAVWIRPDLSTASSSDYEIAMRTYTTNTTSQGNYVGTTGSDTLFGSSGADTLTGGAGADRFLFTGQNQGLDTITDFQAGQDRIEVVGSSFGNLPIGQLDTARFALNAPGDADDRFVFNTTTGALSYDPDGNGAMSATTIAMLNVRSLSATDIWVVPSA